MWLTNRQILGEVTTITYARPNSRSLRVTIPQGVAKQFNLKVGDQLDWIIEARNGKLGILVAPKKKDRH